MSLLIYTPLSLFPALGPIWLLPGSFYVASITASGDGIEYSHVDSATIQASGPGVF